MKGHRYWIVFFLSWLLWTHSWPVKKDGSVDSWSVDSSYETQQECETAAIQLAERYDFYVKDQWKLKGKREYKQLCYLDTVDPKEVKQKPKQEPIKEETTKEETKEAPKAKQ